MRQLLPVAAILIAGATFAQEDAPRYQESIEVSIVNLDVVVRDRAGKPVRGLTAADFEIRENGQLQEISNFYEAAPRLEGTATVRAADDESRANVFAPVDRRNLVIFVEGFSMPPVSTERFFNQLKELVRTTIRPGDKAAIVSWRYVMKVRQDFTDDVTKLNAALDSIHRDITSVAPDSESARLHNAFIEELREEAAIQQNASFIPSMTMSGREQAQQALVDIRRKTVALTRLVNTLAGAPGKRILLMATRRFSQFAGAEFFGGEVPLQDRDYLNTLSIREDFARTANAAGVTIYPIYPEGLEQTVFANAEDRQRRDSMVVGERTAAPQIIRRDTDRPIEDATRLNKNGLVLINETAAISEVAVRTGGVAAWGQTDIIRLVETIKEDLTSYYSMAYRADSQRDGKPRRVTVTTKDKRHEVRARREQVTKTDAMRMRERVVTALYAKIPDAALLFDAEAGKVSRRHRRYRVPVRIAIPMEVLTSLPSADGERGSFTVFAVAGGMLGVMSEVAHKTQSFVVDPAKKDRAQQAVITYELEIETDGRADRIAIGLLDDTSREWGVMTIPLGSRRRTDGT